MPVAKYTVDGVNWIPITPGPKGDKGVQGDQGIQGVVGPKGDPTTLYIQPGTPVLATPPSGIPLWLDTDAVPTGTIEAVIATQGNLLTANQASVETDLTGFSTSASNTMTRMTSGGAHGSAYLRWTLGQVPATYLQMGANGVGAMPVTPGATYTISFSTKVTAVGAIQYAPYYVWWDAAGAYITEGYANVPYTAKPTAWTRFALTVVAPANAAFMTPRITVISGGTLGDIMDFDQMGVWKGAGGEWAMPGTPILGIGYQVTHPNTDDVLAQVWDSGKARWQILRYDSGIRSVPVNGAGWSGTMYWRRSDDIVSAFTGNPSTLTQPASGLNIHSIALGWKPYGRCYGSTRDAGNGAIAVAAAGSDGSLVYRGTLNNGAILDYSGTWTTNDPIPTSLPGTLVSAAPALYMPGMGG